MSDSPNETALVRISTEAHAMLREIAQAQRRTLGAQAEVIIEMAWNNLKSNPPVANAQATRSNHYPLIPMGS